MKLLVKILAWYTIVILILSVILAPFAVDAPLSDVDVVIGTVFYLPTLAFAILFLIVYRRS